MTASPQRPDAADFLGGVLHTLAESLDVREIFARISEEAVEGEIRFKPPIDLDAKRHRDWIDPIVGVVLRTPGKGRWHAGLQADFGGFGVGSEQTWQVFPTVGVDLTKSRTVSLEFGWRVLDVDYEDDDEEDPFEYDVRSQGPAAGLAIRF